MDRWMENGQIYILKQVKIIFDSGGRYFYYKWVVGFLLYNSNIHSVVFKFFRMLAKEKRENWMKVIIFIPDYVISDKNLTTLVLI